MATLSTEIPEEAENPYQNYNHVDLPIGDDGTPFDFYKTLRDRALHEPVGWTDELGGFWVVAGFNEIREVMRRPDEFSNRRVIWPAYHGTEEGLLVAAQDDPDHRLYRALVQADFSPAAVTRYDAPVRRMTNELIDSFIDDGECEVSDVIADEVPARLTAYFLGFEEHDSATYRRWADVMAHGMPDPAATQQVLGEMFAYFRDKVQAVRRAPGDDVLSRLAQVDLDGRPLTEDELIGFCALLLLGGIHNSAKVMANAFWHLGWDHALRRQLVAQPELIPPAMEEFMRYYTPATIGREVAVEGARIGGVSMKKGQVAFLALPAGNRDPREFSDPDEFVIGRSPNRHLALGHGIHACLGGSLIRVEIKAIFEEFLRRIPEFELDTSRKKPRWQLGQVAGLSNVVLTFPTRH